MCSETCLCQTGTAILNEAFLDIWEEIFLVTEERSLDETSKDL